MLLEPAYLLLTSTLEKIQGLFVLYSVYKDFKQYNILDSYFRTISCYDTYMCQVGDRKKIEIKGDRKITPKTNRMKMELRVYPCQKSTVVI